jgi:hypothetical protein
MDTLALPFKGENFQNMKCITCQLTPLDVFVIADGIECQRCECMQQKQIAKRGMRFFKLPTDAKTHKDYLNEIELYVG